MSVNNNSNYYMINLLYLAVFQCTRSDMEDNLDKAALMCVKRAYRDFCRTLTFNKNVSEKNKSKIKNKWEDAVAELCKWLLRMDNKVAFDSCHEEACINLIEKCNEGEILTNAFSYGQAQKWINMTLKYMLLTELWDNKINSDIEKYVHVPVDSYVLKATANTDDSELKNVIEVPNNNGGYKKYTEYSSKKWSQWNFDDYKQFIDDLRCEVEKSRFESLYQWENVIWLKMASRS